MEELLRQLILGICVHGLAALYVECPTVERCASILWKFGVEDTIFSPTIWLNVTSCPELRA